MLKWWRRKCFFLLKGWGSFHERRNVNYNYSPRNISGKMRRYYSHKLFCSERKLRTRKKEANTWPWAEITKFYEAHKLYQAIQWQVFPQSFDDPGPLGAASQKFKQEKVEYLMNFWKVTSWLINYKFWVRDVIWQNLQIAKLSWVKSFSSVVKFQLTRNCSLKSPTYNWDTQNL